MVSHLSVADIKVSIISPFLSLKKKRPENIRFIIITLEVRVEIQINYKVQNNWKKKNIISNMCTESGWLDWFVFFEYLRKDYSSKKNRVHVKNLICREINNAISWLRPPR